MGERILVTGGAGYIGSHACKALARQGHDPVTLDSLIHGHEDAVKWGPLVRADILDRDALDRCFREFRPDAVMHFAAFAYVGESVREPAKYYRNNVAGSLNLLEAMQEHDCGRIIFSSTCSVYGSPNRLPLDETHEVAPINPYGASKLMIERIMSDFGAAYGLESVALRYFNAAGADPDGELGERHDPETHLIPLALGAAMDPARELTVFGTNHDTPDGTCVRDYVHVTDLAEAHALALDLLRREGGNHALNLGCGNGYSVLEVIETAGRVAGKPVAWKAGPVREGDPSKLVADARLATRRLGWKPRYQNLELMIRHAGDWMRNHD